MRGLAAIVALLPLTAAAVAGPGPSEPFGGDDAGCVPPARPALACSDAVAKALGTLVGGAARCHARQADARYDQVTLGHGGGFDEEGCETSVGARFTGSLEALAAAGTCAGTATLSAAAALETVLLADSSEPRSLDAANGAIYCDPTSGAALDPGGDDAGTVPATKAAPACADPGAKNAAKLPRARPRRH